jgi:ATP-binding cassette, subfamily B, multidrug efflux pump
MKSLSYLNKYFFKYRWRLLLGVLFIVINNYFGAKIPVIMGDSIDMLTGKKDVKLHLLERLYFSILSKAFSYS